MGGHPGVAQCDAVYLNRRVCGAGECDLQEEVVVLRALDPSRKRIRSRRASGSSSTCFAAPRALVLRETGRGHRGDLNLQQPYKEADLALPNRNGEGRRVRSVASSARCASRKEMGRLTGDLGVENTFFFRCNE